MPATDRPGILFDILRRFYDKRITLISIMSRPTKQSMGTYNFYIEIDCLTERLEVVVDTLRQIQVLEGEDVEKMDALLSLAITGGNFEWI